MTIGGFGLKVKIKISSTMTIIASLLDGEIPEFEKILAEMTSHQSTSGYAVYVASGKRKMNEFKCTLGWDSDEATHAAILTVFDSNSPVDMCVVSPDGTDEVISFSAHISKIGRVSQQEDGYKAEVSVQPTASPTLVTKISFTGRSGAGACTCTGANVGDVVIQGYRTGGAAYSGVFADDFEDTITVEDQIQQAAVGDLSGVTFLVKLMPAGKV